MDEFTFKTPDPILTVPEVARYLKISKSKIYYLVSRKQIPHIRMGRNIRIRWSELILWLTKLSEAVGKTD